MKKALSFVIILLLISPIINAWGVSSFYHKRNPIKLAPGDTQDIVIELQNMIDQEDVIVTGEIKMGKDIAAIIDKKTEYVIPFGRKDIPVNIRVSIPENVSIGTSYEISVFFMPTQEDIEGGTVQFIGATEWIISVQVVDTSPEPQVAVEKEPFQYGTLLLVLLILALLIIITVYLRKKKDKK